MGAPQVRRVRFGYPDHTTARWHATLPEFACAANAVSLMMPYVEPFVVRSMRSAAESLEGPLLDETRAYIAQEAQHHRQHRVFNERIAASWRGVAPIERLLRWTFDRLWERTSDRFHVAYSAASEAIAYGVARWVERHHAELFAGADPAVASLYLWHLAEEVEHKNVAFDVYDRLYGVRRTLGVAMVVSFVVLACFTLLGTTVGLWNERRLGHPVATWRLCRWAFGFVFSELPNIFAAAVPGHRPSDFTDPTWFALYLVGFDAPDPDQEPANPDSTFTAFSPSSATA